MSLRFNINLLITIVMVLFLLAFVAFEIDASRRSIEAEMAGTTLVTVQMLRNVIRNDEARNGDASPQALVTFLQQTGRIRAHDVRVEGAGGTELYASPPSPYKAGRVAPHWFTNLIAPPLLPIELQAGVGKVFIVPDASRPVLDAWDELLRLFWLSFALFALVNLAVFWFASRALHPINDIVNGLLRMGLGEFDTRLPRFKLRELAVISDTFNGMAKAVQESFAVKQQAEKTASALKENRELTQLIQRHTEDERRNLALELHDELGQSVTAVKSIATYLANRLRDKPEEHEAAQTIVTVSGQMYDSMHDMVRRLRPLALDKLGLHDAIQELVGTQRARNPQTQFNLSIAGDLGCVDADVSITAYRIVQECLTNIARHSNATRAEVTIQTSDHMLITVWDNGKGFGGATADRFGLMGMRERAQGLGGEFRLSSEQGAHVHVKLPLRVKEGTA